MPPTMQAFLGYKTPETLAFGLVEGKDPCQDWEGVLVAASA